MEEKNEMSHRAKAFACSWISFRIKRTNIHRKDLQPLEIVDAGLFFILVDIELISCKSAATYPLVPNKQIVEDLSSTDRTKGDRNRSSLSWRVRESS